MIMRIGIIGSGNIGSTEGKLYNAAAKQVVAQLIRDSGFAPYDVGDADQAVFIEPPRGENSLYGEEWHRDTIDEKLRQLRQR